MFYYNNIMLEVTRRCNLACEHCLRGKQQKKDMEERLFYRLPEKIGSISITGGEPTLYPNLFEYMKRGGVWPENLWIKSNGKCFKRPFALEFIDYVGYMSYQEPGMTSFTLSADQYHHTNKDIRFQYEDLFEQYGVTDYFHVDNTMIHSVIAEGNAKDWGDRKLETEELEVEDDYVTSDIYIGYNGNVSIGCNRSFVNADKAKIGNIFQEDLDEIIKTRLKKQGKQKRADQDKLI